MVLASLLDALWAGIVWIAIGGVAGAIGDYVMQEERLGTPVTVVIGIGGGVLGGLFPGLIGMGDKGNFWTYLACVCGAVAALVFAKRQVDRT